MDVVHTNMNTHGLLAGTYMKILVADDEEIGRRTLEYALKNWGHDVVTARDGREAWDLFTTHQGTLDIAILDWMMPEIDGLTLCRQIRNAMGKAYLYIIMLTAREKTADIVTGLKAGADDYITKPYSFEELEARVHTGNRIVTLERALASHVVELEDALANVKRLQGLLPICSYCKKIRDDKNYWQEVERYVGSHAEVRFSHGICPDCMTKIVEPQLQKLEQEARQKNIADQRT